MRFVFAVAGRYLFARDSAGRPTIIPYIGVIGIALGVIVLIVVNAIYAGYSETLQRRLLAASGHVVIQGRQGPISDWQDVADTSLAVGEPFSVRAAYPMFQRQVLLRRNQPSAAAAGLDLDDTLSLLFGEVIETDPAADTPQSEGKDQGAQLTGFTAAGLAEKVSLSEEAQRAFHAGELILGERLAKNLGVQVGDELRIIAPAPDRGPGDANAGTTTSDNQAIGQSVRVGAIQSFGLFLADSAWAVMDFDQAGVLLRDTRGADRIELFLDNLRDPSLSRGAARAIDTELGRNFLLFDQRQNVAFNVSFIQRERQQIALVVGMTLLVASVGIVSGLVMLVHDKRREIAVLRTMGASQGQVLSVFLVSGAGIGLFGLVLGLSLGCLIAWQVDEIRLFIEAVTGANLFPAEQFGISKLPSKIEPSTLVWTSLFTAALVFVAAAYPAWRAAQVDPALGVKGA